MKFPTPAQIRERDRYRARNASDFELDDMNGMGLGYDRAGMGMGPEAMEMMRRTGPGRGII